MSEAFARGDPGKHQFVEVDSFDADEYDVDVIGLHNAGCAKDSDGLNRERPEHRIILNLKLAGKTNREISEITETSYQHICKICRQRWFLEKFAVLAQLNGKDAIQTLFETESLNSVQTLIEIRDSGTSETNRRAAAEHILDRFLGKPKQHIDSVRREGASLVDAEDRIKDLDQKIKEREQALNIASRAN